MREKNAVLAGERKRLASKTAYAKNKHERKHALLRLRPGSLARLDAARTALGLSRSAYIDALLEAGDPPVLSASRSNDNHPARSIGDEFEALFGGGA